jgi:hypothetical protein
MSIQRNPSNVARDIARQMWPKRQPRRPKPNRDGFPERVKQDISRRSAGMCELDFCGPADHYHHRAPRGAGGTRLAWVNAAANALHVALPCHARIEAYRSTSYANGWLVARNGNSTAAEVPVLYRGRWVNLADDGSSHPIGGAA